MPRVSAAFFLTGGLFVLCGMGLGMYMGGAEDFRLAAAHAHLNLLGWVTMGLYGAFYALTAKTMLPRLAWMNWGLSTLGVILAIPALGYMLVTGSKAYAPVMMAGEFLTIASLGVFLISAVRELTRNRTRDAAPAAVSDPLRMAAE